MNYISKMQLKKEKLTNARGWNNRWQKGERGRKEDRYPSTRKPSKFPLRSLACGIPLCFSRRSRPPSLPLCRRKSLWSSTDRGSIDRSKMSRQTATRGLSVRYMRNMSRENDLGEKKIGSSLLCGVNLRSACRFRYESVSETRIALFL